MDKLPALILAVAAVLWLLRHLALYNRRNCPSCKGAGKLKSGVFGERWRSCGRCGGSGHVRGWLGRPE
ncbi:hypothetical protein J5X84_36020 [Streptosporangiaceae bacterium NEAU-GS5]|nr:hypothetical protein [Streptosporangiaceae bacterium NEAU-GS5]